MRYKQWIFIGVLIVFLLTCGRIDLLAADTGFSTTKASSEEATFPQNVELSLLESEPSKRTIALMLMKKAWLQSDAANMNPGRYAFIRARAIFSMVIASNPSGHSKLS